MYKTSDGYIIYFATRDGTEKFFVAFRGTVSRGVRYTLFHFVAGNEHSTEKSAPRYERGPTRQLVPEWNTEIHAELFSFRVHGSRTKSPISVAIRALKIERTRETKGESSSRETRGGFLLLGRREETALLEKPEKNLPFSRIEKRTCPYFHFGSS